MVRTISVVFLFAQVPQRLRWDKSTKTPTAWPGVGPPLRSRQCPKLLMPHWPISTLRLSKIRLRMYQIVGKGDRYSKEGFGEVIVLNCDFPPSTHRKTGALPPSSPEVQWGIVKISSVRDAETGGTWFMQENVWRQEAVTAPAHRAAGPRMSTECMRCTLGLAGPRGGRVSSKPCRGEPITTSLFPAPPVGEPLWESEEKCKRLSKLIPMLLMSRP